MSIIAGLLVFGGAITAFIGGIWILVLAFQKSVLWGLGCLVIPLVSLVFVIMNWEETKKPFGINVLGAVIMVIGSMMMPTS